MWPLLELRTTTDAFNAIAEPRRRAIIEVLAHERRQANSQELKTVHDWVAKFEQFWTTYLDRVKERAERKASGQSDSQELQSDKKKGSESS
jgi:hypothetical protein